MELLKVAFVIRRTSTLFESGVEPVGIRRRVYGGVPPEPVMSTVRFWHWRGVEAMLNEYAAASDAKGAAAARAGSTRRCGLGDMAGGTGWTGRGARGPRGGGGAGEPGLGGGGEGRTLRES